MKNVVATKEDTHHYGEAVVPHHDLSMLQKLHSEMNRVFDGFSQGLGLRRHYWSEPFSGIDARVDVKDDGDKVVVTAEVPGVLMEDLEITATANYLSIAGEKKREKEEEKKGYYHMERQYGYFRRVVPLPCEIESDAVDAVFKDGVLTISLPKTQAALKNARQVTIKAG
jgi:HSP20 family protein